jgi:hypothetical protein
VPGAVYVVYGVTLGDTVCCSHLPFIVVVVLVVVVLVVVVLVVLVFAVLSLLVVVLFLVFCS